MEVCINTIGEGSYAFVIPKSITNVTITDPEDFKNDCFLDDYCTNLKFGYSDGYSSTCFEITIADWSKSTTIPISYLYYGPDNEYVLCEGPPIEIPSRKYISGTNNLSDINSQTTDPLLPANLSPFSPQSIIIGGNLIIDEDYTFGKFGIDQNSIIILEDDAKITVNNGVNFTIRSTYIHGCEKLWDKIDNSLGGVINMQRCKIEDSRNGVWIENSNVGTQVIVNNDFNNNGIGIKIPSKSTARLVNCNLMGNRFTQNSTPIEPLSSTVGIDAEKMSNALIQGSTFGTGIPLYLALNLFSNNTVGIKVTDVSQLLLTEDNNFYSNQVGFRSLRSNIMVPSNGYSAIWSSKNNLLFTGWDGDITLRHLYSTILNGFPIDNDDFDESFINYKATKGSSIIIENNYAGFNKSGINLLLNSGVNLTIRNHENTNLSSATRLFKREGIAGTSLSINSGTTFTHPKWIIRNNVFDMYPTLSPGNYTNPQVKITSVNDMTFINNDIIGQGTNDGIILKGGLQNLLNCNYMESVRNGLSVESSPHSNIQCNNISAHLTGLNILGDCDVSYLKGNTLNSGYTDLAYGSTSFPLAITGPQPALGDLLHGNIFNGSLSSNYGAIDYNTDYLISEFSKFFTNSNLTNNSPDFSSVYPYWFESSNGFTFACDDPNITFDCSDPTTPATKDLTNLFYILDSLNIDSSETWNLKRSMYEWHRNQPGSAMSFVNSMNSDPMYDFYQLDSVLNTSLSLNSAQISALRGQIDSLLNLVSNLPLISLQDGVLEYDPPILFVQTQHTIDSLSQLSYQLQNGRNGQIDTLLPSLIYYNHNITVNLLPQTNQKQYNDVYLHFMLSDSLRSNDSLLLQSIANQCPFSGGQAVYQAQSILNSFYDLTYDNACTIQTRRSKVIGNELDLYPDTYTFYSMQGVKLLKIKAESENEALQQIKSKRLVPTGIYLIVGTKNENVISHTKVFVQ